MSGRFKLCERCGSEFVPAMESCIDCGGPLVEVDPRMTTEPGESRRPASPAETTPPPLTAADEPRLVREEDVSYVQPLAKRLRAAGIRCEVNQDCKKGCAGGRVALWVPAADLAAAAALDREHFADLVPDAASFVDLDGEGCPACDTPRIPGGVDCAECGLTLGFGPEEAELAL